MLFINLHFYYVVIRILLILGCIESNPGPNCTKSNTHAKSIKSISIVHNNVCSLLPKLDIITSELSTYDIIAISETHLDKTVSNNDISIDGFHPPIRKDRNRHGGGVALYITDQLAFYERKDLSTKGLELVWSEIHNSNKKFF